MVSQEQNSTGWRPTVRAINTHVSSFIDTLAGYATVVLGIVMTSVVLLGVFFRYVMVDPLSWSEELSTMAMVWLSMIGGSMGIKRYSHVGVSYVVEKIPWMANRRTLIDLLVNLLILVFLILLILQAWNLALMARPQISPALSISMFWPYFGLVFGGSLMIIQVVAKIVEALTGGVNVYVDELSLGEES